MPILSQSFPDLFSFLEEKHELYNRVSFIEHDPISIPHKFSKKEDIEISAFFSATLAWGKRNTIIRNGTRLMNFMDNQPYDFICNHSKKDVMVFDKFVHRTFQKTDCIFFIQSLQNIYINHGGLEELFSTDKKNTTNRIQVSIENFRKVFFEIPHKRRTEKHISSPAKNSACKRINMFLRWMVRTDKRGVDFGIWKKITPSELMCPLDLHTARVGRKLNLITRKPNDWKTAVELTENLKRFSPEDPVKYDFALFGLGVYEKF